MVLLAVLGTAFGTGPVGWAAGVTCGAVLGAALVRSAARHRVDTLGPADLVTVARATLSCGAAALVAESFVAAPAVGTLATVAVVALALDAVDGQVARRTGTGSAFGARLDGEADAFLMLVLSVYLARPVGPWVLAVGLVRYVFAAAGWALPWLRAQLPPRYWRKVVTATAGVALVVGVAEGAAPATYAVLAVATALLAESFGRDVWWLWRRRHSARESQDGEDRASVRPDLPAPLPSAGASLVRLPAP